MIISVENSNPAILKELGARIKRGRIDMQISQADFAKKAGISVRTLSVAENGGDLRVSNLLRILRVMGNLENLNSLLPELLIKHGNGVMKNDAGRGYALEYKNRNSYAAG